MSHDSNIGRTRTSELLDAPYPRSFLPFLSPSWLCLSAHTGLREVVTTGKTEKEPEDGEATGPGRSSLLLNTSAGPSKMPGPLGHHLSPSPSAQRQWKFGA